MLQRKKWDIDFLGALPTNDEIYEILGRHKTVFVNSQNYLQYFIKVINETPISFPRNQTLFTCYSTELEKYGFEENFHEGEFTRVNELVEFLMDSLILFKPSKKSFPTTKKYIMRLKFVLFLSWKVTELIKDSNQYRYLASQYIR